MPHVYCNSRNFKIFRGSWSGIQQHLFSWKSGFWLLRKGLKSRCKPTGSGALDDSPTPKPWSMDVLKLLFWIVSYWFVNLPIYWFTQLLIHCFINLFLNSLFILFSRTRDASSEIPNISNYSQSCWQSLSLNSPNFVFRQALQSLKCKVIGWLKRFSVNTCELKFSAIW